MAAVESALRPTRQEGDAADVARLWNKVDITPITVRIPDAVKMLGLSRSRIYELITSGEIEVIKLGRTTLIPIEGLNAFIERLRHEQSDD